MPKICFFELMDPELPLNYSSLKAKGNLKEKQATLEVSMTLKGKAVSFTRLPKTFAESYQDMQDNPDILEIKVNHTLSNMSIEFYATPDSKKPMLIAHGVTITGFVLERPKPKKTSGKKRKALPPSAATMVTLWFDVSLDVKNDKDAKLLTWDMLGNSFYWKCEPGQGELISEDVQVTTDKPKNLAM